MIPTGSKAHCYVTLRGRILSMWRKLVSASVTKKPSLKLLFQHCLEISIRAVQNVTEKRICPMWRFRCQQLPAPALISPLLDYGPRWIALLCLVVCIARRCQIVSSFVLGGCCVALQMLMRAGVLSWIKPGERFRSLLGSVVTIYSTKKWINNCFALESCMSNRKHLMLAAYLHSG